MPKSSATEESSAKNAPSAFKEGLEDVVAGDSEICFIDGIKAKLLYRGYDINDLAVRSSFEEVAYLLWFGELPTKKQYAEWTERISKERTLAPQVIDFLKTCPRSSPPMSVLRTVVSLLSLYDLEAEDNSRAANINKGIRLLECIPTAVAAFDRIRKGKQPIAPRSDLSLAENFLYMLSGKAPDEISAKSLDAYFILLADHEFNASTFTARTTVATLSDLHSAMVAAIGALKGDLHGSANRRAMELLIDIKTVDNTEAYVKNLFVQKKKLMGFGHRVYKVRDPRAEPLARLARNLGAKKGNTTWYEISEALEKIALREKVLYCNVDLYSASVLALCGIPIDMFTCMFACGRTAGWVAHVLEQLANNRLIRPISNYVGPKLRKFVPIEKRV